MKTRRDFWPL